MPPSTTVNQHDAPPQSIVHGGSIPVKVSNDNPVSGVSPFHPVPKYVPSVGIASNVPTIEVPDGVFGSDSCAKANDVVPAISTKDKVSAVRDLYNN